MFNYKIYSQNIENKQNQVGQIALAVYLPEQVENMPVIARNMLNSKLALITSQAGLGGSSENEQFIITANITVSSKDITPTAPPMTALNLDITIFVGDGINGRIFSSTLVSTKGVGENETKAYLQALKNLNISNPSIQECIEKAKLKIIDYYNNNCDLIIKQAQTLANQDKFDEAIFILMQVPNACSNCYKKCTDIVSGIYNRKIERECPIFLGNAKNLWATGQNLNSATKVGEILSKISPHASCYNDVRAFADEVAKRVKELDQRDWDFKLKEFDANVDITKSNLEAWRDVTVAYLNYQPKIVYNIKGWW